MSHSSRIVPLPVRVIRTFEDEEVCADEEPSKPIILLAACIVRTQSHARQRDKSGASRCTLVEIG